MKKLVIGILAHVDAGKTTLSESMLYLSGRIRKLGRVDNKDAFLDTFELERARGITIFSKQAVFETGGVQITLLDTPGHVDFSAEMERTLQVLDYAILVINGADGVQSQTHMIWKLLDTYRIPVFLFINKMDQVGTDKERLMEEIKEELDDRCIEFCDGYAETGIELEHRTGAGTASGQSRRTADFYDRLAMCDEFLMDFYLESGTIEIEQIQEVIRGRKTFPCYFGSALKLKGVEELMQGIAEYSAMPSRKEEFGARVFKISRDEQGSRLTHMKITGGKLKVKDVIKGQNRTSEKGQISTSEKGEPKNCIWEEKVNQIRIYSGQKYEAVNETKTGSLCAVTGLSRTFAGEGLGVERNFAAPFLEPGSIYRMVLPEGYDPRALLPKLRQLEEEEPALYIVWDEQFQEIRVCLMGEVQIEILKNIIKNRFGLEVSFAEWNRPSGQQDGDEDNGEAAEDFEISLEYDDGMPRSPEEEAQRQREFLEYRRISQEEIEQIISRTFYSNQGKKSGWRRHKPAQERYYESPDVTHIARRSAPKEEYLLVDGYNIVHAWPELAELADGNMDGARLKLLDALSNYQWLRGCRIIVVFDAYRVQGHQEEIIDYHNIQMVYTREAQTADQYIEKFAHDNKKNYNITVATSDGLQQMIVRGSGAALLSARELKADLEEAQERLRKAYLEIRKEERSSIINALPPEIRWQLQALMKDKQ